MNCSVCGVERPDADQYCGCCGATLDADAGRLRQQVIAVVRETVKDGDVLANEISTKIEDRLWRWGKILGLAGTIIVCAFAIFGIRSFTSAKNQIDSAATVAAQNIQQAGERNAADLNQQGQILLGQLEKEAGPTEAQLKGLSSRSKADTVMFSRLEDAFRNVNGRMATLQQIQQSAPQTPIGSISGSLIEPTTFSGIVGPSIPSGKVYRRGSSGPEIEYLKQQLTNLGCYSGAVNSQFDDATEAAVESFQAAFRSAHSTLSLPLISGVADIADYHNLTASLYMPFGTEQEVGEVGWSTWNHLFEASPVHCK